MPQKHSTPPPPAESFLDWATRTGRHHLVERARTQGASAPDRPAQPGAGAAGAVLDPSSTSHTSTDDEALKRRLSRMRRGVLSTARLLQEEAQDKGFRYRAALLTLTYRPGAAYEPGHLGQVQTHIRNWLSRRGHTLRDVWVSELQQRGAVHFHVLVFLPRGLTLPKPDKQGWWPHGFTNIKWVRKPVAYVSKYASKGGRLEGLPKGARLWGYAGLRGTRRDHLRWFLAPEWLKDLVTPGDVLRRVGRWWENRTTGIAYRSPYELLDYVGGRLVLVGPTWTEDHVRFL